MKANAQENPSVIRSSLLRYLESIKTNPDKLREMKRKVEGLKQEILNKHKQQTS